LKEIGRVAFYVTHLLSSIHIPNSVEKIGGYCFKHCTFLRDIVFESDSRLKEILRTLVNTFAVCLESGSWIFLKSVIC
jgi:hypothetical protein